MDYSSYILNRVVNKQKLLKFGFVEKENQFVLNTNLKEPDLFANITIAKNKIDVRVIDKNFNSDYMPFNIKNHTCPVKVEVEEMLNNIAKTCFESLNIKQSVIEYMKSKYGTNYEQPWEDAPLHYTFKTNKSKKWYAIIMNIKARSLGLGGDSFVDVINLKLMPSLIEKTIDNKIYFPAYHMNKKHWISVLLCNKANLKDVKNLIDKSFALTEKL